jgi:hypothetical protein
MRLLRALALLALASALLGCPINPRPKPPTPTPPPFPEPACQEGQTTCCWHQPPGNEPLYACPAPEAPGGVLNVAGGPAQCPGRRCDAPVPPPTCPPGQVVIDGSCTTPPVPPSGEVPAEGVPLGPERLLRVKSPTEGLVTNDGKPVVPFLAVSCCMEWAKCPENTGVPLGAGWPMVSACWQSETKKYGVNMRHYRVAPWYGDDRGEPLWAPIGGLYNDDGSFNQKFIDELRARVYQDYQDGAWSEIVPFDDWWFKNACGKDKTCGKQIPLPQASVDAWGKTPDPNVEAGYRRIVQAVGCFGNTFFATGNEEDLIPGMKAEHIQWRIDVMRKAFREVGCNFDHIIGTGSFKDGIAADFQITHQTEPVTGPCNGRWCYDNEHNPEFVPDQESGLDQQALKTGQHWGAWRAGASDVNWEKRLDLYKANRGSAPPPVGCFAPGPYDSLWQDPPTAPASHPPQMMAAFNAAKAVVGNRCGANGQCTPEREPCAPPIFLGCMDTSDLIAAELRKQGYCSSGSWGGPEVAILAPDGWWEQYHPCATETGCYVSNPYKFAWKYNGTNPTPGPTPPPASQCTNPDPIPIDHWNVKEHTKGPDKTVIDSTPIVHSAAYCSSIGFTDGRIDCPVRMEGDPLRPACEAQVVGTPQWTGLPGGRVSPENPYQYFVPRGTIGTVTVCTNVQPKVCGSVQVTP